MVYDLIVIGGGAAGFYGAIICASARPGSHILILEKGNKLLSKVLISGGGRCNVTHACYDPAELVRFYPRGGRALLGPFQRFQPRDITRWFERRDIPLKTEPDGRIFPVSDSAETITSMLIHEARRLGIEIETHAPVVSAQALEDRNGRRFVLTTREGKELTSRRLLLATGGERAGLDLAASLGHSIVPPVPSLFTFTVPDPRLKGLLGITVDPVRLRLPEGRLDAEGALLITHWGLSGPAVLRLSAWGARFLHDAGYQAELLVNWLPDYNQDSLYNYFLTIKEKSSRQHVSSHDPLGRLPVRLWKRLVEASGVAEEQTWGVTARHDLNRLAEELTLGRFRIRGKGEFKEEFVTSGGVALKEVDFKTMQSQVCPGLYLAGEVLDVDALTGGFNLQNAWTTGYIAGQSIAQSLHGE